MTEETYTSGKATYAITVYPGPADGKKHPMILVLHGNAGMKPPFGPQIQSFAKELAAAGYVTAVPRYYVSDPVEPIDIDALPHVPTLADAIAKVAARTDADPARLGLVGYSLGAATAMSYIASNPPGKVKVLVDFFGPLNPTIEAGVSRFPPTFIRHNTKDMIVAEAFSTRLAGLLGTIPHDKFSYTEDNPHQGNHPFKSDGPADKDSRKKAREWVVRHLPPGGH